MRTKPPEGLSKEQEVGYEFLNSLASVRSLSELLNDHPGLDAAERMRFIAMINQEAKRLVRLLAELKEPPQVAGVS